MKSALLKAGLVAGIFFPLSLSQATTFGPIPLVGQAEHSQYVVRGRVAGASWTNEAPDDPAKQPHTYWRVSVTSQHHGRPLGSELIVRQPGGEIGDRGYHVAGTAEFAAGEDTFILLHDTGEGDNVKEVVSLAAGKYRVETAPNGQKKVVNGLGLPVTGSDGRLFTPEDFAELIERVSRKEATDEDRSIFVNRASMHEAKSNEANPLIPGGDAHGSHREPERRPAEAETAKTSSSPTNSATESTVNPVQESAPVAEENSTGSSKSWIFALLVVLGLIAGLVLALRR